MKTHALGAIVLALGLAIGAGFGGEAKAFAGGGLTIESAAGALQPVHYKKKHHKHHHHHHHKKHRKGGVIIQFGNVFGGPYGYGGFRPAHRECHGVVKNGYFNGRYAKIGGTKCYDHYGRGYIVEGSRYVIHYY